MKYFLKNENIIGDICFFVLFLIACYYLFILNDIESCLVIILALITLLKIDQIRKNKKGGGKNEKNKAR